MQHSLKFILGITSGIFLLSGCQSIKNNTPAAPIGMANPASLYCAKQGGQSFTKKDSQGSETGYCRLANGTTVDEWDFYRQNNPAVTAPGNANTQSVADNTTLIITYEAGKKDKALQAITAMQGKIIYDYKNFNMFAAAFYNTDIEAVKHRLEQQSGILSVQRNQRINSLN